MINLRQNLNRFLCHLVLIAAAFTTIFPFYWMIKTSLVTESEAIQMPPQLFAWPLHPDNYAAVFQRAPMARAIMNSIIISAGSTVGVLFFSSIAAFAFAKLRFKWSSLIFGILFATMLIPSQVTLIPMYLIFSKIGWIDSFLPLIVPQVMVNAYGVFLLRQFIVTIPDSYIEAAKIEGTGFFSIYLKITIPLCRSALLTLGMFCFVGNWNNFIGPLIYLNSEKLFTVPLIVNMFRSIYQVNWPLLMTASTIAIIPLVIIYLFVQRTFVEGITLAGIKG